MSDPYPTTIDNWNTTTSEVEYSSTGTTSIETFNTSSESWVNAGSNPGFDRRTLSVTATALLGFIASDTFTLLYNVGNYFEKIYCGNGSTCSLFTDPSSFVDATSGGTATKIRIPITAMTTGASYTVSLTLGNSSAVTQTLSVGPLTGPQNADFVLTDFSSAGITVTQIKYAGIRLTRNGTDGLEAKGTLGHAIAIDNSDATIYTIDTFSSAFNLLGPFPACGGPQTAPSDDTWWGTGGSALDKLRVALTKASITDYVVADINVTTSDKLYFNMQRTGKTAAYTTWDVKVIYTSSANTPYDFTGGVALTKFQIPVTMKSGIPYTVTVKVRDGTFNTGVFSVSATGNDTEQVLEFPFTSFVPATDITQINRLDVLIVRNNTDGQPRDAAIGNIGTMMGADPHVLCIDGSRVDVYSPGYYSLLNCITGAENTVCNIEVVRNSRGEDSVKRAWIGGKGGADASTIVAFTDGEPTIEQGTEAALRYIEPGVWSLGVAEGLEILFEPKYAGVGVRLEKTNTDNIVIGGDCLALGRVRRLNSLDANDDKGSIHAVTAGRYGHSALLCGSMDPHVVTLWGSRLNFPSEGFYNFLRTGTGGGVNVEVDAKGSILAVCVCDESNARNTLVWSEWIQNEDDASEAMLEMFIFERVLVRAQGARVLSLAVVGDIDIEWTGAAIGTVYAVNHLEDFAPVPSSPSLQENRCARIIPAANASLYERMLEPYLCSSE